MSSPSMLSLAAEPSEQPDTQRLASCPSAQPWAQGTPPLGSTRWYWQNQASGQLLPRLLSQWAHADLGHWLSSTLLWWLLASRIERRQGKVALLSLLLISSYTTNLIPVSLQSPPTLGLSGVIMSLLTWSAWHAHTLFVSTESSALRWLGPLVLLFIGGLIWQQGPLDLLQRWQQAQPQVNHLSHLIGFATGVGYAMLVSLLQDAQARRLRSAAKGSPPL